MFKSNMYETKTNLSSDENLEEKDTIVSSAKNQISSMRPYIKQRKRKFGCAKESISVPDNFDDIDVSELFEGRL